MNNKRRRAALAGTVLLSAFSLGATPVQAAGDSASGSPQRVIVVMRDQLTDLPMRTQAAKRSRAAADDQAPVVAQLKKSGATRVQPCGHRLRGLQRGRRERRHDRRRGLR
ncbi:hypothetical protein [Streptomyces canus]|uniref:hypothetical protein n=1 Tax=Streptomyces canus TaxID=58343 RepID=UPI002DDA179C|nr:hypothetical protein [Streptomyces canus]WSD86779.1 hypothetical protein OG925_21840 [Streptomyces canus]